MLMIALQEIGIEGSRMNLQGAHVGFPVHVNWHGAPPSQPPPSYNDNDNGNNNDTLRPTPAVGTDNTSNPPGSIIPVTAQNLLVVPVDAGDEYTCREGHSMVLVFGGAVDPVEMV
ncbi:hypothetical protein SI65_02530 [Aspergillus cristatus]|uniref:Uncharacterized protein n=1 Tax=Aspergillus cristatus TaxID=573508 RepID=A0A1E3BMS7_ASPCR|nr:hypothetical protein SI65_02530 [Aspergillus cristatus]